jgi:hypothetical protein
MLINGKIYSLDNMQLYKQEAEKDGIMKASEIKITVLL